MSWEEHHRRHRVLDGVLADVAHTGRPVIPAEWDRPIAEVFGDEETFLAALGYRWLNRFTARLDQVDADQPTDADAAVDNALAIEQPELSALLIAYADRPAVVTARAVARRRGGCAGSGAAWRTDTARVAVTA